MKVTVSTHWLAQHLTDTNLVILDASWYLPPMNRDAQAEHASAHIKGAQFFDIDAISDPTSDLPHMMPSTQAFAKAVGDMGIDAHSTVIIYDGAGLFSAARVWWMLRTMGHDQVFVLDGGLPAWAKDGYPVTDQKTTPVPKTYTAIPKTGAISTPTDILGTRSQIIDARPTARFQGAAPEPRSGLRAGHIPKSKNVFFKDLLTPTGHLKPDEQLRDIFKTADIDIQAPIITSCGSGVTAAILTLVLCHLDAPDLSLYDGSWAEWGARTDLPIETS